MNQITDFDLLAEAAQAINAEDALADLLIYDETGEKRFEDDFESLLSAAEDKCAWYLSKRDMRDRYHGAMTKAERAERKRYWDEEQADLEAMRADTLAMLKNTKGERVEMVYDYARGKMVQR